MQIEAAVLEVNIVADNHRMFVLIAVAVVGFAGIDANSFPGQLAVIRFESFQIIYVCLVGSGS